MSGALSARDALRRVAHAVYMPTLNAGKAYAVAQNAIAHAGELTDAMRETLMLIIAAEHLKDMAAEAEKSLRAVLATTMNDTGCTQVQGANQMAYLSRKPAFVSVDQADLVPQSYMVAREPALNTKQIKADIEAGQDVPGVSLHRPNDMQLNIRAKAAT